MKMEMKRIVKVFLMVALIVGLFSMSSGALSSRSYSWHFTTSAVNNMYHSALFTRQTGNAYVNPSTSSIGTIYFLSPQKTGYVQATQAMTLQYSGLQLFTWYSGYGGVGTNYCLAACPDNDWYPWPEYDIAGTWAD